MYGKRRIVIERNGKIVLAGNKSWIPIGRYQRIDGMIVGKLRNIDSWDTLMNETNSTDFKFVTVSALRDFVEMTYSTRLIN